MKISELRRDKVIEKAIELYEKGRYSEIFFGYLERFNHIDDEQRVINENIIENNKELIDSSITLEESIELLLLSNNYDNYDLTEIQIKAEALALIYWLIVK